MIGKKMFVLLLTILLLCAAPAGMVCGAERTVRLSVSGCDS
jgi:hypothetical protein